MCIKGKNNSRFKDRTGEKHINNQGSPFKIIECISSINNTIQFENGYIVNKVKYVNIINGKITDLYHRSVHGVGYLGYGKYTRKSHRIHYNKWVGMLERVYAYKEAKNHLSYKDVTVCEEWHCFQNFAKWFEENWKSEYIDSNWELDKDLRVKNNKIYSPNTCFLLPKVINGLFAKCKSSRGKYAIGVRRRDQKFESGLTINKKKIGVKRFKTETEAFNHYKYLKEQHIKKVADEWRKVIGEEIYFAMINYKVEITD